MNESLRIHKGINAFLEKNKEEIRYSSKPSISFLERYAELIIKLIESIPDHSSITDLHFLKRNVNIFKEDLIGELQQDYDHNLKRYPGKWDQQKVKIDGLKNKLIEILG
jgi:hypothetical protein